MKMALEEKIKKAAFAGLAALFIGTSAVKSDESKSIFWQKNQGTLENKIKFGKTGFGMGVFHGVGASYSDEILNRTVTSLNGKSAEVRMTANTPLQYYLELNSGCLSGTVGIRLFFPEKIASYRYFWDDPAHEYELIIHDKWETGEDSVGLEIAYLKLEEDPSFCFSLPIPISYKDIHYTYLKIDFSAGPIAIVQGTESNYNEMNESTIGKDWMLHLGVGIFYSVDKSNYIGIDINKSTTLQKNLIDDYSIGLTLGAKFTLSSRSPDALFYDDN
jgi:hypothetical protein